MVNLISLLSKAFFSALLPPPKPPESFTKHAESSAFLSSFPESSDGYGNTVFGFHGGRV